MNIFVKMKNEWVPQNLSMAIDHGIIDICYIYNDYICYICVHISPKSIGYFCSMVCTKYNWYTAALN